MSLKTDYKKQFSILKNRIIEFETEWKNLLVDKVVVYLENDFKLDPKSVLFGFGGFVEKEVNYIKNAAWKFNECTIELYHYINGRRIIPIDILTLSNEEIAQHIKEKYSTPADSQS